jgi:photosystem II stability/assembly factor-like uncharacterized protein
MLARRSLVFVPVLLILLLSAAIPSRAGIGHWTPIGPMGGTVRALAAAPSRPGTLYAAVGLDKIYRSGDRGNSWTFAGAVEEDGFQGISDVAVDPGSPQRVYALGFWQVFRSDDGGARWRPVLPDLGPEVRPQTLVVHPLIRGLIYVYLTDGDLLRTTDSGRRWTRTSTPAVAGVLAADPSSANVLYFGSFLGKLYKSVDGGATWSLSDRGLSQGGAIQALVVDPSSPRTLYLVPADDAPGRDLFVSRNGGASWSRLPSDLGRGNVRDLAVEPGQRPGLYLTLNGRPFRSFDGGRTWTEAAPLLSPVQDLLLTPSGLMAGTATGIYRSTDRGASWFKADDGLRAVPVERLALDPLRSHLYATSAGFLFKTPDGGGRWHLLPVPEGVTGPVVTAPSRPGSVFAGTIQTVQRSVNGGREWAVGGEISCALPASLAVDPTREWVLYLGIDFIEVPCGQSCRTFKSIDAGSTWTCISDGLNGGGSLVVADPRRSGVLYAESLGRLYRSEDDGLSWSLLVVGLNPLALAISPADPQVLFAGVANGVGRSEDGGRTWRFDTEGLPEDAVHSLAADPVDSRTVYAAAFEHGVFKSTDGGATWTSLGPELEGLKVTSLVLDRDRKTLYAGTGLAGVWALTER